jgi:hypothetical protein
MTEEGERVFQVSKTFLLQLPMMLNCVRASSNRSDMPWLGVAIGGVLGGHIYGSS